MEINGRTAYKLYDKGASLVCFWEAPVKNNFASETEGRPVFDIALMGQIRTPGAKMTVFEFMIERRMPGGKIKYCVNDRSERWVDVLEKQLSVYHKQKTDQDISGTPLESWPRLDVAMIASLKASGIFSLEALAEVPDSGLDQLGMNGRVLREQAKAMIEQAKGNAPIERLTSENEALRQSMERMQVQLQELSDKYAVEEEHEKRGPGRPRKVA